MQDNKDRAAFLSRLKSRESSQHIFERVVSGINGEALIFWNRDHFSVNSTSDNYKTLMTYLKNNNVKIG